MKKLKLEAAWNSRLKLRAEGDKLWAEGNKLWAEGNKLRAEGDKLWAEGDKLWAEGDKLWAEKIIEVFGNIKIEWRYISSLDNYECELENGEIYKPKKVKATLADARKSLANIK